MIHPSVARPDPLHRAVYGALFGLAIASAVVPAHARADQPGAAQQIQRWNIPAGPLAAALEQMARRGGLNLSYDAASLEGRQTAGVNGSYDNSQALSLLLQGSGMQAQ